MDSIANHPFSLPHRTGSTCHSHCRQVPQTQAQSKANLHDSETLRIKAPAQIASSKTTHTPSKDTDFSRKSAGAPPHNLVNVLDLRSMHNVTTSPTGWTSR